MLRFQVGRSYAWLFAVFAVLILCGYAVCEVLGHPGWGVLTLPAFMTFLVLLQLRSQIALDSWWGASDPSPCWQYRALMAFQLAWVLIL